MKTTLSNLIAFIEINENIIEDFYSISFFRDNIKLQGHFTTEKAKKYSQLDFKFSFEEHLNGKSLIYPNIEITLT